MAPIEGECRITNLSKTRFNGVGITPAKDKGCFVFIVKEGKEGVVLNIEEEEISIHYGPLCERGYITISNNGLTVTRGSTQYSPTISIHEIVEKNGKDLTIGRSGRYSLTVKNT